METLLGNAASPLLIVDDDEGFRALVSELLASAGFETREAASGREAVALARGELPLLVVLDMRLPDVSGLEVCRQLREEFGEELPIVFVSGDRTEPLDRSAGLLIGGDDYLVKPVNADEFLARVHRLLRRSSARRSRRPTGEATPELTKREREILKLLTLGRSKQEIADTLVISAKTVASHLQRLMTKLGVHSQAQAVAAAYQRDLIDTTNDDSFANGSAPARQAREPVAR